MIKDLKVGDIVEAVFRKFGKTVRFTGAVTEVSTDEHALDGTWVAINVHEGDFDAVWQGMIKAGHYSVLVPIADVKKVLPRVGMLYFKRSNGGVRYVGWDRVRKVYSTDYYANVGIMNANAAELTTWKAVKSKREYLANMGYTEVTYLREDIENKYKKEERI